MYKKIAASPARRPKRKLLQTIAHDTIDNDHRKRQQNF